MTIRRRHHCHGKQRYPSMEAAQDAIVVLQRRKNEPKRRSKRLGPYWCRDCQSIHIGHRRIAAMPKES